IQPGGSFRIHTLIRDQNSTLGPGSIISNGPSELFLDRHNSYTGTTTILQGKTTAVFGDALGTPAGSTSVSPGATLFFIPFPSNHTLEPIFLAGTIATGSGPTNLNGPVQLTGNSQFNVGGGGTLTVNGALTESGGSFALTKVGSGTMVLTAVD